MTESVAQNALRHRPLVFIDNLDVPILDPSDHHHLAKALRLRPGSPITIADGLGRWRLGALGADLSVSVDPDEPIHAEAPVARPIAVGFTPVKGDRPEWVIQKLTELGVNRIAVIESARSVIRWDSSRATKQWEKWQRVVREAAMQSRQLWLPTVEPVRPLRDVLARYPHAVLAEPGADMRWWDSLASAWSAQPARALGSSIPADPADAEPMILIGPEGGWSPDEIEGHALVGLPGGILRAETASLVAASVMVFHRSHARSASV